MKNLDGMSTDELWALHTEVTKELAIRIAAKNQELERRLAELNVYSQTATAEGQRRPYPKVLPKYRNPRAPSETWSGRGKPPRWLVAELKSGKKMQEFRINEARGRLPQPSRAHR
jgi:DNA-binding protein H-NS